MNDLVNQALKDLNKAVETGLNASELLLKKKEIEKRLTIHNKIMNEGKEQEITITLVYKAK